MPDSLSLDQLGLDPADLGAAAEILPLLAACPGIAPLRFRDGEKLVVEDETSQDLFIVLKGCLVVERRETDGAQRPLAQLECEPSQPSIVGEMAYFGAQRRTATVRAVGACQALCLRTEHVDAIMAGFPGLTRIVCQQFTRRLQEANDALRDLRGRFDLGAERRMAQPGELLFQAGERAPLFQLGMGTVRLERGGVSETLAARDLPDGFLGLAAYLRDRPQGATAVADDTCFLAVIPASRREAFLRSHPGLALRLLEGSL